MANEIQLITELTLENGNVELDFRPETVQIDQASARYINRVDDIGTSEETLSFGDITTKGLVAFKNLDSTNYVSWGFTTGNLHARLNAGETAVFRMDNAGSIIMQANTATCKVQVVLLEN